MFFEICHLKIKSALPKNSKLEVYCYTLKKGEVDELIIMLGEKNFKLGFVDKNSIKAIKEGNHREVYQAKKKLEKEGFR